MPTHHARRTVLKTVGGLITAATGVTTTAAARDDTSTKTETAVEATPYDWLQYEHNHEPRPPATDLIHHLASGLRYTDADADGTHTFTVGGQFGVETPDNYPPHEGAANTESQTIRIVNETPMKLSLFFPVIPVAMYPSPPDRLSIPWLETLSGISATAIPLLKKVGLTLLKRGVFWLSVATSLGVVLKHFFRDTGNEAIHHFQRFTPRWNDIQGRHLGRFRVHESSTDMKGRLLLASQTRNVMNAWQLTFDDGLTDVSSVSRTPPSRHSIKSEVRR